MSEKRKRKWGDRRDARWVRDVPGLQAVMAHLMPNRTDCEVYLQDTIDVTELTAYLEEKNAQHPEYKTTLFHCFVTVLARMLRERPLMNRYLQGRRTYERYDVSLAFVCKRRFTDHAEESLMFLVPKDTDTIEEISKKIIGDVRETRKSEHATGGIDSLLDLFAKLPRPIFMFVIYLIRVMDFWGISPKAITDGDPNYASVFFSNLGSIKCPSVYHHLNNYGTNSIMITIGTIRQEPKLMEDGTTQVRTVVDIGATLDERIADGFYFARSLKLVKYICAHPELLERPLNEPSGFDYQ